MAVEPRKLRLMKEAMRHRGPDGEGEWFNQDMTVGLAHRRLAILDLSDEAGQPMRSEDGRLQVVFNGEIYNHPELKEWCEAHGASYRTNSDTETLLHLYAIEGPGFVHRLRGMFAFALWDESERSLLMVRDPLGIKPLYYAQEKDGLCFASEIKALLAGGVGNRLSAAGVTSFYLWGYVTEPHSWYDAIRMLPAGHMLTWRQGGDLHISSYHDVLDVLREQAGTDGGYTDLGSVLRDSVKHHFLADVPVGLFLSAGIDSTALLSLASECTDTRSLAAITVGFEEYSGTVQDESPLASMMAERVGCLHKLYTARKEDFLEERRTLFRMMDQPTVDGVNTYLVSSAAAKLGVKAAMSGVGGDEVFGGYPSFRQIPRLVRNLRWFSPRLGRAFRKMLAPGIARLTSPKYAGVLEYGSTVSRAYFLRRALFMPWELGELLGEGMARDGLEALDVFTTIDNITADIRSLHDQVMALELAIYLRNCLLRDADWAGMAHGLEIRTPLVDKEVLAGVVRLRALNNGMPLGKGDLANAPRMALPKEITERTKTGFTVPIKDWLLGEGARENERHALSRGDRAWAREVARHFLN